MPKCFAVGVAIPDQKNHGTGCRVTVGTMCLQSVRALRVLPNFRCSPFEGGGSSIIRPALAWSLQEGCASLKYFLVKMSTKLSSTISSPL